MNHCIGPPIGSQTEAAAALTAYDEAADGWLDLGCVLERAIALLGAARCASAHGHQSASRTRLQSAREVFAQLGARPLLTETDELLGTPRSARAR